MIKRLFRWAFRLLILLIVLAVAAVLLLDTIARSVFESQIRQETGMDVKVGALSIGLLSPVITLEDFKLYNTADFGGGPMVDIPELHVEYDRRALFSRKLHFRLVRFNLAEVNLVQSKKGQSNLGMLQKKAGGPGAAGGKKKPKPWLAFGGIDTFNLTLRRITVVSMNTPKRVREYDLGIRNQIIPNISSEQDLALRVGLLVAQNGGLGLWDVIAPSPTSVIKGVGQSIGEGARGVWEDAKDTLKK